MRELWGLFVEDATFTVGIVAAVLIAALGVPRLGLPAALRGPCLLVLVVLVLVENVVRSARASRRPVAE